MPKKGEVVPGSVRHRVIEYLKETPATQAEIMAALGLHQSSVNNAVKRAERDGQVYRVRAFQHPTAPGPMRYVWAATADDMQDTIRNLAANPVNRFLMSAPPCTQNL